MEIKKDTGQTDLAQQYVLSVIRIEHPEWIEQDGTCERCEQYYESLDNLIALDE